MIIGKPFLLSLSVSQHLETKTSRDKYAGGKGTEEGRKNAVWVEENQGWRLDIKTLWSQCLLSPSTAAFALAAIVQHLV